MERGVSIQILVPGPHIDKRISKSMAEETYAPLVRFGAEVFIYQPSMMHVKAFLVDGVVAMVGSINVNRRSMMKDEETSILILDEEITSTLESHFKEDLQRAEQTKATENSRSFIRKLISKVLKPVNQEF